MKIKISEVDNKQGFKIIVMPALAQHVLFYQHFCDLCSRPTAVEEKVYYESVIDQFYCEKCHKMYINGAIRYKPDIKKEEQNYERVKKALEGANWWNKNLF